MTDEIPSPPLRDGNARRPAPKNAGRTVAACVAAVGIMTGLSFAAVPLYSLFCKVTGFGGTPRVASANETTATERRVSVRLDANVAGGLGWRFEPETPIVEVHLGETTTVFFKLTNAGPTTTMGIASFNVLPELAAGYFNKIQCFCFSDITLKPGESMDAPVVFYVDPKIDGDADVKGVPDITLSYSFFPSKAAPRPVAEAKGGADQGETKPRL